MNLLTDLFLTFAKIGLFTFGGGYAMISMIEDSCVERKGWLSHDELMDITVIAESTPGPIAINCATYTGYKKAGFAGAAAATVGIVLPSFAVIYLISMFLDNFLELTLVAHAFRGIKIAVGILILEAALNMVKKMRKKPLPKAVMLSSFAVMLLAGLFGQKLSSIRLMLAAAAVGLAASIAGGRTGQKGGAGR